MGKKTEEKFVEDDFISAVDKYYGKKEKNGRMRSWERCYAMFYKAREEKIWEKEDYEEKCDLLALHLGFYLASWGMYRGSTFLLQKDHTVHIEVVKKTFGEKYRDLFGITCAELADEKKENLAHLKTLSEEIRGHYETIRKDVKGEDIEAEVSDTLVTKALLGTLGCVPAYDTNFVKGIQNAEKSIENGGKKLAERKYGEKSIKSLAEFYERFPPVLKKSLNGMKIKKADYKYLRLEKDIPYPQMKLLDMGFWQLGIKKPGECGECKDEE